MGLNRGSRDEDEGDDEAIKGEGLAENEDEDEADEEFLLLSVGANAHIPHDADGVASSLNESIITTQLKPQTRPEAI